MKANILIGLIHNVMDTIETYEKIINNGYPPEKVVFGMLAY